MTFIFPKPSSETSDSLDDDDSAASVDKFLGQSRQDIERVLSRGKSFNNEASNDIVSSAMDTAEVDEEIQDLNTVLGNGNEDFDFRTLNKEELITMLRGEPTRETYSNIGNMSKFMHPELARTDREAKKQEAKKFKTSQRDPTLDNLTMSVEYSSLSKWKVAHNSLHAQDAYLNIIKFIFLRESSLLKIRDIVQLMDQLYWKYANILISRKQYFKNNESTDELKQMCLDIHSKQELLSVALAHHRSISVDIVEGVHRWRRCLQRDVQLSGDVASLFWNGQNYLIKMLHDTPQLFETQTMWMWLGFKTDCFILPPRHMNPHTERLNRERKFHKWKQKRDDRNTAALKMLMGQTVSYGANSGIDRGLAVRRQASVSQVNNFGAGGAKPVARRGKIETEGVTDSSPITPISISHSTPTLPPIGSSAQTLTGNSEHTQSAGALTTATPGVIASSGPSTCLLAPRRQRAVAVVHDVASDKIGDDGDEDGNNDGDENSEHKSSQESIGSADDDDDSSMCSSSVTTLLTDDTGSGWRALRDSCKPSWDYYFKGGSSADTDTGATDTVDRRDREEDFWDDLDHNEHMVEAAMGHLDLFPRKYIVPPLKKSLIARCRACEEALHEEVALAERVKENIAISKELKINLDNKKLKEYMDELDSEEKQIEKLLEMEKLQSRQASMNVRDQFQHNEISRDYVAGLLGSRKPYQRYIASASKSKSRAPSPSRASPSRTEARLSSARPISPTTKNSNMFAVFLTAPSMADGNEFTQSTVSYIPDNVECRMDPTVLKGKMASVVDNDRQACIRIGSSLVLRNRVYRNNRALAYQNKPPKKKRNAIEAIVFMQALMRGVITRNRMSRKNKIQSKLAATLFIQKCLRIYVKKCRARVKRKLFKADCLRVRHEILVSHRAADVIKIFFRYVTFMRKRLYFLNKYSAIERLDVPRMSRVLRSAKIVQSLLRGYSTRAWFYNVVVDSRKRSRIGPKYKTKVIQASRREHHHTIAGSGGFKYWWRNAPEKNSAPGPCKNDPFIMSSERFVSSVFMTGADSTTINNSVATIQEHETRETTPAASPSAEDRNRRRSIGVVSEESVSLDGNSQSLNLNGSINSHSCQELKKRSNIRGKIAMLKSGSRSHHKGVNLLRAVPVKEREFIQHKGGHAQSQSQSISGGGGSVVSSFDGSAAASRSHTYAYENPNVHFKAKQARTGGGLSGSLYGGSASLDSKRSNELNGLLQDVYGFQK